MSIVAQEEKWSAIEASVRGASHERGELPNQDAVKVQTADGNLPAVLVVSDGHGSPKCFRSDLGARLAVEVAASELAAFAETSPELTASEMQQAVREGLPKAIVRKWRDEVARHFADNPFREDELNRLDDASLSAIEHARSRDEPYIAYGATLVSLLVTDRYLICLQLGDGDILVIDPQTGRAVHPLAADEDLIANETTSLCQENAWTNFRSRCSEIPGSPPPLILLSTDGYANSFATPAGFQQVAEDFHNLLSRDGVEKIRDSLPGWLNEASQGGSGDDVTVAILFCPGGAPFIREAAPAAEEAGGGASSPPFGARCREIISQVGGAVVAPYVIARRWFQRNPDLGMLFTLLVLVYAALRACGVVRLELVP